MPRKKKRSLNPYTPMVSSSLIFTTAVRGGRELDTSSTLNFEENSLETGTQNSAEASGFDDTYNQRAGSDEGDDGDVSALLSNLNLKEEVEDGILPPAVLYFGWFFKSDICAALKEISIAYLQQCYFAVAQFERFLAKSSEKRGVRDHLELYTYPSKSRKTRELPDYHVTAKYCGRERRPTQEYGKEFGSFLGAEDNIHIIGLFFTENTYGFRVKLTTEQALLFDERSSGITGSTREREAPCPTQADIQNRKKVSHSKEPTAVESEYHPKILLVTQEPNFNPTVSRAHITIGCAPNVKAFQAGEELKDLINLEMRPQSVFTADYVLANGDTLRQFGRFGDAFIVYLSRKFVVSSEFNFKT